MMRILTLSTLFPDTSRPNFAIFVERHLLSLAKRGDVEIRVVAPLGIPPWPLSRLGRYATLDALPNRENWKGLEVYRPRFRNLPGTGGRFHASQLTRAVLPILTEIRRDFPFDLIAAEFFFPGGPAAVALGKHFGVPVSITARGTDIHYWAKSPAVAPQIRAAAHAVDGMVAVSHAMRDDMIALGMPGERIISVTTGVDIERFALRDRAAAKAALGVNGPLVASVGALIPLKGHDIVIDAVARLPGVNLRIAGTGPEAARLQARIERLGVGDRIQLMGAVSHDCIPDLMAAADVMALASEREGLANVWLESLASGTPIVIPNVGGARQAVTIPETGRLVARTPEAFAEAIAAQIATAPDPAAVRRTVGRFTWAENSARLHAHYRTLVEKPRLTAAA